MEIVEDAPLIDTGRAEEFVVTGLAYVTRIDAGWAEFGFFRSTREGVRMIKVKLIAPVASVGPAFDLCVENLGSSALVPMMGRERLPL